MTSKSTKVFGPYSPIRRAGNLYFTAGQVGVNAQDKTADTDVRKQTAKALENLAEVLKIENLTLHDVVKVTLFLTDMYDFAAVNEVYVAHFSEPRPARSTVGVRELPHIVEGVGLKVEIEAIAARTPK